MDTTGFDDVKSAIIVVVILLNITSNAIVIAVLLRYPQLREDNTNIFILSLTLSDLAHGCTSMPVSVAVCAKSTAIVRNVSGFLPKIHAFCEVWFTMVSMQSLCWVTLIQDGCNQETVPLCSTSIPKAVQFVNSSLLDVWGDDIHYAIDMG